MAFFGQILLKYRGPMRKECYLNATESVRSRRRQRVFHRLDFRFRLFSSLLARLNSIDFIGFTGIAKDGLAPIALRVYFTVPPSGFTP